MFLDWLCGLCLHSTALFSSSSPALLVSNTLRIFLKIDFLAQGG